MAYQDDLELQNQQKAGAGGVIAGSGGAASPTPGAQPAGSGFTNLQTYLAANKGQGVGVAGDIVSEGQKGVDSARKAADQYADTWATGGVQQANQAGQDAAAKYDAGRAEVEADPNNTEGAYAAARGTVYGGPANAQAIQGYNDLEKNYQNVKTTADNFAGDYNTQKAGLQNKYGYGSGFGALDTFLGRQDGKDTISGWQKGVQPGSAAGQIGKVTDAIAGGQRAVSDAQTAYNAAGKTARQNRSSVPAPPTLPTEPVPGMATNVQGNAAPAAGIASQVSLPGFSPDYNKLDANTQKYDPTRRTTTQKRNN